MPDELPLDDEADAAQEELDLDLPEGQEGDIGEADRT